MQMALHVELQGSVIVHKLPGKSEKRKMSV